MGPFFRHPIVNDVDYAPNSPRSIEEGGRAAKHLDFACLGGLKAVGMVWADVREIIVADAIFHDTDSGSRQSPNDGLTNPWAKGLIIDPRLLAERRPDRWRHLFSKLTVLKDDDGTREMTYCSLKGLAIDDDFLQQLRRVFKGTGGYSFG